MDALTKAFSLIEIGCWVFPARVTQEGEKVPCLSREDGGRGHLDASNDPEQIHSWFSEQFPDAHVGVHAGRSGLVLLDRDIKRDDNGKVTKNGYDSLTDAWLIAPETFNYTSVRGEGQHDIYVAPDLTILNGKADYRGLPGVDRRGGSSWWLWAADEVPTSRDAFAEAPDWLCDPAMEENLHSFQGTPEEWLDSLVQGEPNLLVRGALGRIPGDMSHSEMVERQKNAIRLGAEGATGVPVLLEAIREAWMNRPEDMHSTPKDQWAFKFEEALESGIRKYGEPEPLIENLPAFDVEALHGKFNTAILTGEPQDKQHFSKVLNRLIEADFTDDERASILWNSPATKDLAREWGIDFVYQRVEGAHRAPEPERENPQLEEKLERGTFDGIALLSETERDYIAKRPTFVNTYMAAAKEAGIDNEVYTRAGAWNVASMAFAFRGFIPQGADKKMGVNLHQIVSGSSGTGKTTALEFEEVNLDNLYLHDNPDGSGYATGSDTSPQGLHLQLLERDRKPTMLVQDEASVFFQAIKNKSWIDELTHSIADWYNGRVRASSKISLKELRGKTALTSFHMSMMATPDRLFSLIDDGMFETGFLARVLWVIAPPPTEEQEDAKYVKRQYNDIPDNSTEEASPMVKGLVADLVTAARLVGNTPKPILADDESLKRMYEAHKLMGERIKGHLKWNILEPSVTRLGEDTLRKCAAICAMYRGDTRIRMDDTLHAIAAVEIWFNYLLEVVDRIAQGAFQQLCNEMELFILKDSKPTETKVLNAFRNKIERDPRELMSALNFLVSSGRVNREEESGKVARYVINGGVK